jgi:hypothetical protein
MHRDKSLYVWAFIICQFLFFIDEGYYDFRWMKSVGNWIVFVVYFVGVALLLKAAQFISHKLKKH